MPDILAKRFNTDSTPPIALVMEMREHDTTVTMDDPDMMFESSKWKTWLQAEKSKFLQSYSKKPKEG
jgi:hypothetical protein